MTCDSGQTHQASVAKRGRGRKIRIQVLVKLELAFNAAPFVRTDPALMRIADGMQRAVEVCLPVVEELLHLMEIWSQIAILPDISLPHEFKSILKNQDAKLIDFNLFIKKFLLQCEENRF